jgi:hypothetical protein
MEKNQEGAVNQPFSRTTSNSFVSPSQYVLIESAPIESDRAVLIRIRDFVAGSQQETTASGIPSLIDPFLTTLTKDKKALLECNDFLWKTVLQRFGLETSGPLGQPQRLPKKVIIQLQNTLRRLRDPSDTTSLRPTEHVEIQVAWHLRRIQQTKDVSLWVKSILALQCLSLPATYSTYVDTFLQKFISPKAEYIWETLTVNEHLLWSSRRRIELYATQQKLLAEVKKPEPAIIQLATPPCTGKTLMAAGLMTASPSMTLVFCCISPGVYLHVARLLYHLGIWPTFIFGDRKIEPNFKISRVSWDPRMLTPASQYLKTVIPTARAFIVDFNLCHWFLRQLDPTKDILLFLDEPTMGADGCEAFVHVPALLATILKSEHLPAKVVLSSATLPSAEDMVPLIAPWHRKYPDGRVVRIDDAILTSSISLVSMETGHLELPHASCETIHDLSRLISRIGSDIVLLKAYSGLAVHLMREAHKVVYGTCPTFEDAGISWKDLEIMSLRRYAIYMLEAVSRDFRQEFCAWKPRVPTFPCLDISKIALEFSPYVPGQTLIVSRTTEVLARSIVDPLIAERKLRHLEGALQQEVQSKKMFEEQSKKIKDKEERQMYDESQEFHRAVQFVPDELVIHTAAHLRRYGGDGAQKRFPKEFIRRPPPSGIVRQVLNAKAEEWLKHSFLAGVMYTDVRMHTQTSSLVGLMEASLMDGIPIAAVDRSFSYGVNVPASNVVINEDAAEDMSYNSIVQFINRVARLAGTDAGRAFLCKLAMQKLLNGDDGQEARVLHEAMMK